MSRILSTTIPGVKQQRVAGRTYYRHRKTGEQIRAEYPSPQFDAELKRLNAVAAAREAAKAGPVKGTIGALIEAYRASPEFAGLAPRTQADYRDKLDYLKPGALGLLGSLSRAEIMLIRDKAHRDRKWHFANYLVTVMGGMFKWGIDRGFLEHNPARGIDKIARPKRLPQRNRPWSTEECEIVLAAAPSAGIRAIIALGMFAGAREHDAVAMTWEAIDKDGWIRWTMRKTGDAQALPIAPRLAEILKQARGDIAPLPARRIAIGMRSGEPYTLDGFRAIFFRMIQRLEREGKVRDGLTFHGLRHTLGKTLATGGASTKTIQTLLGHRTSAMAEHYSKEYDRIELAKAGLAILRKNADG